MFQEMNERDALQKYLQGKKVFAAPDKITEPGKERYLFRPLEDLLSGKRFLVEEPAVENSDFRRAIARMMGENPPPSQQDSEQEEMRAEPMKDNKNQAQETRGYTGFLHIRCEHCGKTKAFCTKYPLNYYQCEECDGKTELLGLKRAYINCECGNRSGYFTNETADVFDLNCINCGMPVALKYNAKKNLYEAIRS